jgi:type IV secretory pathway TrbF-like protein
VALEVKSVTKLAAPESYQVLWEESVTEKHAPTIKVQMWTGTFTVGRISLKSMDDIIDNRLGICVTAFERLCRKFCSGGQEGAVALVCGGD